MSDKLGRLRIALPNKGRLADPAVALLRDAGVEVELGERRLSAQARNVEIELLFVRTGDITEYVRDGLVSLGITGQDLVAEFGDGLAPLLDLGFGACSLVLAVPVHGDRDSVDALAGCRIATTFPKLTREFLARNAVEAQVIEVTGAVEVTPQLGMADAVVDLVASGRTLEENDLEVREEIVECTARFVANRVAHKLRASGVDELTANLREASRR